MNGCFTSNTVEQLDVKASNIVIIFDSWFVLRLVPDFCWLFVI